MKSYKNYVYNRHMKLEKLAVINYKNLDSQSFEFDAKINCLVGPNGVGKSNVLDAIYHLSFGKSYFNPITSQNIRHGTDFFVLDATYQKNELEERVILSVKKGQKKNIKRNGKLYNRISDHIGLIPLVIISPADNDLIMEGSETRRRFIDGVISQSNAVYLENLLNYNRVLAQRNALLKHFAASNNFNRTTLEVYNEQLAGLAAPIYKKRLEFLEIFTPIFESRYRSINEKEEVSLEYNSQLAESNLLDLLQQNEERDRRATYTNYGIHRDDLVFNLNGHHIRKFGSQGQKKSYLIALKLAQFDFIKSDTNINPILLLDDIFDKLDEMRVAQLIKLVDAQDFGQLFISDTHAERTENVIKQVHQSYKMINL